MTGKGWEAVGTCEAILWQTHHALRLTQGDCSLTLDPSQGMTALSLTVAGQELLCYDAERARTGATYGIPILYPTPNRIDRQQYVFAGQTIPGIPHGIARSCAFDGLRVSQGSQCISLHGCLHFAPGLAQYTGFPFPSTFALTVTLAADGVQWAYSVQNHGSQPLGYGFALHPFFRAAEGACIRANTPWRMQADENGLPTGALVWADGSKFSLIQPRPVEGAPLDTVFCTAGEAVWAELTGLIPGKRLMVETSRECTHLVVYTPAGKPFFCVEPQTCAADCHNLHAKGFVREANLQLVPAGEQRGGWVRFRIQEEKG